jgi:hypothetical protein
MNNFTFLDTYVLRTAALPVNFYTNLLDNYTFKELSKTIESSFVKNAIRLASPELMQEFDKYTLNPSAYSNEKIVNLEISLLKYIARISSRATPFGLFAGCTTGKISNETNVLLKEDSTTHTQFDMQFWIALLQKLGQNKSLRKQLLYFPNSSLYMIGDFYRYVEYRYVNKKREHNISSVRKNTFLEIIIENSKRGSKIEDLANSIIDSESEREEAIAFIEELIDNQVLVSNLEAAVTGRNDIERALTILKNCKFIENEFVILKDIVNTVNSLNKPISLNKSNITHIENKVKELKIVFEEKYLLQTDLYTKTATNTLNKSVVKRLTKVITFLGNIQDLDINTNLQNFKKAFQKRYENKEMPLSLVLDTETGIGYLQNSGLNDSNPILDNFSISKVQNIEKQEFWSPKDYILEKKLQLCIANQENSIILMEQDFNKLNEENRKLPATFSAMIEVLKDNDKEILVLDSLGNFSASKLIGRFCNGNQEINLLANEIIEKEQVFNKNAIMVEIAHIPESRTGNILRRPILRTFEIPYLSNSTLPKENQIEIDDLMVSVTHNKIILRSKKLNKEIIPCLSNAHNYMSNTLPIYQFLCELQGQNIKPIHKFDYGILKNHYNYFPRVLYKDVILAKAKWLITEDELKTVSSFNDFELWRNKKQLPKYVNIINGDNTLLLDLEKEICFKLLKKTLKSKYKITLEEFLFVENSIVKNEQENYFVNQFILSFYCKN